MSVIKIKKAKLSDNKLEVEFKERLDNGDHSDNSSNPDWEIHPDVQKAFNKLNVHLGLLTDQIDIKKVKDINKYNEELSKDFHISSYSIGSKEDRVVLSGHKILENGKAFNFNTPYQLFNEGEDEEEDKGQGYKFIDHLIKAIDDIEVEVRAYLAGTKKAPVAQPEIPFNEENNR